MSSGWVLCIDFGTAFSKAAAAPRASWERFSPASVRPLMLDPAGAGNPFLLDSAVFVEAPHVLFGSAAIARADALAQEKRAALRSFKTLLSAGDLERALETVPPASIDPTRSFVLRDLIVLYLAYLQAAMVRGLAADRMLSQVDSFERRYAAPAWRGGDGARMHGAVAGLFAEAETVCRNIGQRLLDPAGVDLEAAREAVRAARAAPTPIQIGLIFEATAAAAYTAIGLGSAATHLAVLDMGAGTTDITALAGQAAKGYHELPQARVTLKQAGDFIDNIIVNVALAKSRAKTPQAQTALWRMLKSEMRDFKEALFASGHASFRFDGRTLKIALRDLEQDRDFRGFAGTLGEAYQHAMKLLADEARADGATELQSVAVGGGAAAPFIQNLIKRTNKIGKVKVMARPATPDWAHAAEFAGNLAPVFPQLAIAIGGALAPEGMLAARGSIPAASARSETLPARD
ncbi:MAG: Hsp70 family protein [Hyphomonadaceae bacterium]|nr:Hsp70 family protein [Hyphomonadaceae bacterium]